MFQYANRKAKSDFMVVTLLLVLLFTSSVVPVIRINADQSLSQSPDSNNSNDGKIFDTLYSNSTVESADSDRINHYVTLEEVMLQDGQPAYKMAKHIVNNGSSSEIDKTPLYDNSWTNNCPHRG